MSASRIERSLSRHNFIKRVLTELDESDLVYVERPILLHRRREPGDGLCECGCASEEAILVDQWRHHDLLINRRTKTRMLRSSCELSEERHIFDRMCETAIKTWMPLRAYEAQLPAILDTKHSVIGVFGGVRGGKSSTGVEWLVEGWVLYGGRKVKFAWVAPLLEKCRVALDKLVVGEYTNRFVRPAFHPTLIRSIPSSFNIKEPKIMPIDDSEIHLKHAARAGANLRSEVFQRVVLDEGVAVYDPENFAEIRGRVAEVGGQVMIPTTPKRGHFLEEKVHKVGYTYADLKKLDERAAAGEIPEGDASHRVVSIELSFDTNVFVNRENFLDQIKGRENDPDVQRTYFGRWTGDGMRMWKHFYDEAQPCPTDKDVMLCHLRSGEPEDYGFKDVTTLALGPLFPEVEGGIKLAGGMDFNVWPFTLEQVKIVCPPDLDETDRKNWVMWIVDEIQKVGTIITFVDHLIGAEVQCAAFLRGKPRNYYKDMVIIGDGTAFQRNRHALRTHGLTSEMSSLGKYLRRRGFHARPCAKGSQGSPGNPHRRSAVSLLHHLMSTYVRCNGKVYPRFVVHAEKTPKLIDALRTQEDDGTGLPVKVAGNRSDRQSSPVDATMYFAWPIFRTEVQ